MRRGYWKHSICLLVCAFSRVSAQDITVPAEVKGMPGDFIQVKAETAGTVVRWYSIDGSLKLFPAELLKDSKSVVAIALRPGRYKLLAWTSVKDVATPAVTCVVVIEGDPIPVPVPIPVPIPTPPPAPDTLAGKLKAAYDLDVANGVGGDAERKTVAAAFSQFGAFLPLLSKTDEVKRVIDVSAASVLKGKLPATMGAVYAHLNSVVPELAQPVALTADIRLRLNSTFNEIAKALEFGPGPSPPPGPPGQRIAIIIRETADSTPEFARMLTSLRAGVEAKYLKDKGHNLAVLDDDSVDAGGRPSPIVEKWRPHFKDIKLPALLVIDAGGNVVSKGPLPDSASGVVEAIKKAGG